MNWNVPNEVVAIIIVLVGIYGAIAIGMMYGDKDD